MKDNEMMIGGKLFITQETLSFGDYDNSCSVERANVRYLEKENAEHIERIPITLLTPWNREKINESDFLKDDTTMIIATGGYYSQTAWLIDNEENRELINSLYDYPLLDDETLVEVELKMLQADWESWLKHDLLHQAFEYWDERERIEINYNDDVIYEAFQRACDETGEYYRVEAGGNGYIDIERIAETFKRILTGENKNGSDC